MTRVQLADLLRHGENSGVEFKQDRLELEADPYGDRYPRRAASPLEAARVSEVGGLERALDPVPRTTEVRGLGVPRKIIVGMRNHNDTEPDLVEEENRFLVRLWKEQPTAGHRRSA